MKAKLGEKWSAFLTVLLDPWVILLLLSTIGLSIVVLAPQAGPVQVLLTVLLAISSGTLGGIIAKRWEDITGEALLVARGKAAIRSLKLLLGSTAALERRSRLYFDRYKKAKKLPPAGDLVSTYLEDVIERCTAIEEEVLSSIENWTDIIPEADVKTQIGLISQLKLKDEALEKEIKALTGQLDRSRGKSDKEIENLKLDKAHKERELEASRQELLRRTANFGPPISTGSFQVGGSGSFHVGTEPYQIRSSNFIPSPSSVLLQGQGWAAPSKVTIIDPATGTARVDLEGGSNKETKLRGS